ncbi:MAG: 6-bladed beta-propeller, partial [Bacteroidales bacterium]
MICILRKYTLASGRIIRLFTICAVLLLFSCSGEDESLLPVMPDYFEEITFSLDDIATDLEVIPLSNDVPVLRSRHVEWYANKFYVGDLYNNRIYRFTNDGKYIDMLDRQGRGAEEYLYIVDFFIDERTGHIYISTNIDKIVVYNQDFEFIRNIPYPQEREGALDSKWLNGSIHLFYFNYSGEGKGWVNIDTSGQIINSRQAIDKYKLPCSEFDIQIFENNGRLYRHYNLNDTIYEIDSTG